MQKIMFNDRYGLTKAVLAGRKTQTRRIIPQAWLDRAKQFREDYFNDTLDCLEEKQLLEQYFLVDRRMNPHYTVGEVLAVAQSLRDLGYNADDRTGGNIWGLDKSVAWNNKMFVSAKQCKNHILITGIRLERLQDISDEDCLKEGISLWTEAEDYNDARIKKSVDELIAAGITPYQIPRCWDCFTSPKAAYAALIDKVSGKGTWEKNPWVFVYDFGLEK